MKPFILVPVVFTFLVLGKICEGVYYSGEGCAIYTVYDNITIVVLKMCKLTLLSILLTLQKSYQKHGVMWSCTMQLESPQNLKYGAKTACTNLSHISK